MKTEEISDREKWENFIRKYSPQSFFQSFDWGEISSSGDKNKTSRFFFLDKDTVFAAASIRVVPAKKGKFLHIRHGPVFSILNGKYLDFVTGFFKKMAEDHSCCFIRVSPLIENSPSNNSFFKKLGYRDSPIHAMDGELCWVLDLGKDTEELFSGMRKTTRYLIRKALSMGVKIEKSRNISDMQDFMKLYTITAKRHGFIEHKGIIEEFRHLAANDGIILFKGFFENRLLSVALIVFYNNQAIYHHSASIEQKIPVNYLLQWEVIKEAVSRHKKIYNFWGIAPFDRPKHPWKGLSLFKQGFGGRQVEYMHAKDLPVSPKYWLTFLLDTVRRVRKGY